MRCTAHVASGFVLVASIFYLSVHGSSIAFAAAAHTGGTVSARHPASATQEDPTPKSGLKPEVEALLKTATAEYTKMRSYQHTAELVVKSEREDTSRDTAYTLALERPNRFCYKCDDAGSVAAVSDGRYFINLKHDKHYTRMRAPAGYAGINIVDDVTFEPVGTYLIALMLQGDILADRDVKAGLLKADAPVSILDLGKRYDTLAFRIGANSPPTTLYFDSQTHLLHKAITTEDGQNVRITEIIENVRVNMPIPRSVFEYSLPKDAILLTRSERTVKPMQPRLVSSLVW